VTTSGPDERAQVTSRLPLDAVIEVDADVLAKRLVSLPDEANAILRLLDGRRTLREVIALSGQGEAETAKVAARLHELGVLRVGRPARTPAATPAPDDVEWFAEPHEGAGEGEPEPEPDPHGPADIPDDAPQPSAGWVRDMLARLRR
jgi:hypothetical protein